MILYGSKRLPLSLQRSMEKVLAYPASLYNSNLPEPVISSLIGFLRPFRISGMLQMASQCTVLQMWLYHYLVQLWQDIPTTVFNALTDEAMCAKLLRQHSVDLDLHFQETMFLCPFIITLSNLLCIAWFTLAQCNIMHLTKSFLGPLAQLIKITL